MKRTPENMSSLADISGLTTDFEATEVSRPSQPTGQTFDLSHDFDWCHSDVTFRHNSTSSMYLMYDNIAFWKRLQTSANEKQFLQQWHFCD